MWNLPMSTLWAFIALIITVIAAIVWAIFTGKKDQNDTREGDK